ncbi:hypothetical protein OEZ85_004112 [Tetradesmus obliquus]|uniref:CRC domain-containing protein n=1 Tax=Tetradesmus obliquus TaxID=3088 RepID=A0ABY8UH66_TETOB|nr:hypothetical protein OEZ85_004112 [Tetradesmus obliquus]
MSAPLADEGQGQYFLARVGEQLLLPGLPPPQPAPAGMQYKRCNCKKAKCLKLYCVCFGAGVYCQGCNCVDCSNVPEKQAVVFQERQRILQREPMAFSSKVVGPAHFKGCKCRKSRCVKKYCDCYDAKVRCSDMCKCKDCHNQPHNFQGGAAAAAAAAVPGYASMQPEHGMAAELGAYPGSAPASYPGSLGGSQPGSAPSSRPGSPSAAHAQPMQVMLRPGALPQLPGSMASLIRRPSQTGQLPPASSAAAAASAGVEAFGDPACAGQLAQSAGLGENIALAAMNAAQFLRDIISLSRLEPSSLAALPGSAASLSSWPGAMQQQQQAHREQPELSRLRHAAPVGSPAVASSGSKVAVLTSQPLAALAQPVSAAGLRMSSAVQSFQQAPRHHFQQQPQQLTYAAAAAAAAAPQPEGSQGAAAPADAGPGGVLNGIAASRAKSLSSMAGAQSTPSPVTGHALRQHAGSFRGPSPLGPAAPGSRSGGEAGGLSALLAPCRQQQQQQSHGTPVMTAPPLFAGAPGSGASSAAGGPGGSGSARRSMQLLPGSFRLAGAVQSPAVSHGSPAAPAPLAANPLLAHALGSHLGPSAGQKYDSPAGSISFAPSVASAGPGDTAAAANQEQTPVFSNSSKAQQLQDRLAQQQQQHLMQLQQAQHMDVDQQQQQPMLAPHQQQQQQLDDVLDAQHLQHGEPPAAAAAAAGAQTPLSELTMAAAAAAAAGGSAAPTPTFWQQALQLPGSCDIDALAGFNLFSGSQGGGGTGLHDMTPSSLLIASLLAAGNTPTDMFLTSPLPPIGSALRAAGAATGGASGLRAPGLLRGGDVTPVLLNIGGGALQHGLSIGSGSTGVRRGTRGNTLQRSAAGRVRAGVGVSALCTGWGSGAMAAPAAPAQLPAAAASGASAAATPTAIPAGLNAGLAAAAAANGDAACGQEDAPASGAKADTDKAAARAAAAVASGGEAGSALPHHADGSGCDAGVSSLLAAANFISTPGFDADEVGGASADEVGGASADEVGGASADEVGGASADELGGASADEVGGASADEVGGASADEVGGASADGACTADA